MSVTVGANERLAALTAAGTSVWLDQIRRSLIEGGELQRLIDEMSLRGVTSNPAIFEKAILGSDDYDDELRELAERGQRRRREIYDAIAIKDVQLAADVLRPVYDELDGYDGFVSLEVGARGRARHRRDARAGARLLAARRPPERDDQDPGHDRGRCRRSSSAISEGINVNVTLLFSVESYANVAEAYIRGLERRREDGGDIADVHSVASFFVSRVDSKVDKRLEERGQHRPARRGRALERARGVRALQGDLPRRALRRAGARPARPCSARCGRRPASRTRTTRRRCTSTSWSRPRPSTRCRCRRCSRPARRRRSPGATADVDASEARGRDAARSRTPGIDMERGHRGAARRGRRAVRRRDGEADRRRRGAREAVVTGRPPTIESNIPDELEPAIAERVKRAAEEDVARRIWRKDETLWGGAGAPEIADRLGWLTISETMLEHVRRPRARSPTRCSDDGLTDVRAARHGRLVARPGGVPRSRSAPLERRAPAARARLDRPGRGPRGSRARSTSRRRSSSSRRSRAGRSRRCRTSATSSRRRRGGGETASQLRRDHRPGHPAARAGRGARLPARLPERPRHRRALLGAVVLRARAGRADGRRHRRAARAARRSPSRSCRARRPLVEQLRPVARARDGRAGAQPAATS